MYKLEVKIIDEATSSKVFTSTLNGLSSAQRLKVMQFCFDLSSEDASSDDSAIAKPYQY